MEQTDSSPRTTATEDAHEMKISISHPEHPERDMEIHVGRPKAPGEDVQVHVVHINSGIKKRAYSTQHLFKQPSVAARLAAILGIIAIAILYFALPENLTLGPSWLFPLIEGLLLLLFIPTQFVERFNNPKAQHILAKTLLAVVTIGLIGSVALLIYSLLHQSIKAINLLRDASLLWVSNILVFALWYWEIDGGGPRARHLAGNRAADFQFPQQTPGNTQYWVPLFIDYLFLAFNTSTALSPTDTFPLTRQAKILMMIQAAISLVVIALLASRAVNILGT